MPSKAKSRKPLVVVDASVLVVGTETVQDWTVSVFSLAYGVGRGNGVDLRLRFAASYPSPSSKESQALRLLHQTAQEIPLLFVTTAMGTESIAQLAADSSFDYVEREHLAQLPMAVRLASNERKLRAALEQPALSVSVGVASYPEDADTILLYAADRVLYAMKGKQAKAARAGQW